MVLYGANVIFLVMPISAFVEITGEWWFGTLVCWIFISADVFLCTSSIWNLLIISIERFMAICSPLWYGVRRTKRVAMYFIAVAWTVSVIICLPPLFLKGIFEGASSGGNCNYAIDEGYRIYSAMGSFWIPLVVILCSYVGIFYVAGRKDKVLQRHKPSRSSSVKNPSPRPFSNGRLKTIPSDPSTSCSNELHDMTSVYQPRHTFFRAAEITETTLTSSTALVEIRFGNTSPINNSFSSTQNNGVQIFSLRRTPSQERRRIFDNQGRLRRQLTVNGHAGLTKLPSFKDRERKVFKVLLIILCSFVACWMGFFLIYTLEPFCDACKDLDKRIYAFFLWLGYFNSMLNPLIYAGFSRDFRTAFLDILCCRFLSPRTKRQSTIR